MSPPTSDRHPIERLAEEFIERKRRGEPVSIAEYAERYPDFAEEIQELFPALVVVEQLKPGHEDPTGYGGAAAVTGGKQVDRLGDYRILREIGRGGMGIVYEAEQESLGRHVALKVLPAHSLLDPQQQKRFHREAKAAARMHHTNIVPVYGVGEHEGMLYYVMQYIQGLPLDDVLAELRNLREGKKTTTVHDGAGAPAGNGGRSPVTKQESALHVAQSLLSGRFTVPAPQAPAPKDGDAFAATATVQGGPPVDLDIPVVDATSEGPDAKMVACAMGLPPQKRREDSDIASANTSKLSHSSVILPGQSEGSSLTDVGRHYWQSVARIGLQVADALEYANREGVVHRDIKPSNLLLDTHGTVWITDFGLAKVSEDGDNLTHTGDILGTLRYMAPERFAGRSDARSDIYSLGLTLYELLTLHPAYDESDRNRLINQITHDPPPRPRKLNSAIPRDLETIVLKAIDREPLRRYPTSGALAEDLKAYLDDKPIHARRVSVGERLLRWCRRKPAIAGLAASVALLLLAITAISLFSAVRFRKMAEAERELLAQAVDSRKQAEREKELADANFQRARRAVEDYLTTVSESTLLNVPGMQPLRRGLLTSALKYYQEFVSQRSKDPDLQEDLAAAYERLGRITADLGAKQEAIQAYENALEIRKDIATVKSDDLVLLRAIGALHHAIGQIQRDMGNSAAAGQSFDEATSALRRVVRQTDNKVDPLSELAGVYSDTGRLHAQNHEPLKALTDYTTAFTLQRQLIKDNPTHPKLPQFKYELAEQLSRAGEQQTEIGLLVEAVKLHEEALGLLQKLVKDHPRHEKRNNFQRALAASYESIGNVFDRQESTAAALSMYAAALPIREQLAHENPAVTDYQTELAQCYLARGLLQAKGKDAAAASRSLQQAIERQGVAVGTSPQVASYTRALARMHQELGAIQRQLAQPDQALASFRAARALLEKSPTGAQATDLYALARVRAVCSALIGRGKASLTPAEKSEGNRDAGLAVEALAQAVAAGFRDVERLRQDSDLDLLRTRADFKGVVKQLQDKVKLLTWLDDLDTAKAQAAREGKDLLLYFSGSDWCPWCILVKKDVFGKEVFARYAAENYVLVELDFPRYKPNPKKFPQNKAFFDKWRLGGFPGIVLADADGRAYANLREAAGASGVERYVELLKKFRQDRVRRDALLAQALLASGVAKARFLDQALSLVPESFVETDYANLVEQLLQADPQNQTGQRPRYVALRVKQQRGQIDDALQRCDWDATIQKLKEIIAQLQPSGALEGEMVRDRARAEAGLEKWDEAEKDFTRAIELRPDDADLRAERGKFFSQRDQLIRADADYAVAIALRKKALDQARTAFDRAPQSLDTRGTLSEAYAKLAELHRQMRQPGEAVAATLERAKLWPGMGPLHLYNVACELALCVPLARTETDGKRYADQAMEALREAVRTEWDQAEHTKTDPDLTSLHSRDDYEALLHEMEVANDRALRIGPPTAELNRFVGHTDNRIESLSVSANGRRALSGGFDKLLILWDVDTGKEIRRLIGHTSPVYSVALSPDGRRALSGGEENNIRVWDAETGKEIRQLEGHTGAVRSLVFLADGRRALSSSNDGTLRLWDVTAGKEIRRFTGHTGPVNAVAVSADGRRAVSGGDDHSVRFWDIETGKELRHFDGHEEKVDCVALSPDGRQALSGTQNGFLSLWDTATGREVHRCEGHWYVVRCAAFSADGRHLVSGSGGDLIVWDRETGRECFRIVQPVMFNELACLAGGRQVLTATTDGSLHSWSLDEPTARARDLALVGQYAQAESAYNKLIAQDPRNEHTYVELGRLHARQRAWDKAAADFSKAIDRGTKNPVVWILRGICYGRHEQWEKSATDYLHALELRPEPPDPRLGKARWYHELAEWDAVFPKAIAQRPKDPMLWIARGHVLAEQGHWDQATAHFAKAGELLPDDPLLWRIQMILCLRAGDREAYRQLCARMVERFGKNPNSQSRLQLALAGSLAPDSGVAAGRLLQWAEKAVSDDPQSRRARHALARAYCRCGKWSEAIRTLHEAAALDPAWAAQPLDGLVRALAYCRQGEAGEAQNWRSQAQQAWIVRSRGIPRNQPLSLSPTWWDWVEFQVLSAEIDPQIRENVAQADE
jgi:serine/threonine protein kinase/WD40 repeat protein/thioredoxin-related protein